MRGGHYAGRERVLERFEHEQHRRQPAASAAASGAGAVTVNLKSISGIEDQALVDGQGRTLYLWEADTSGASTCTGPSAAAWPPVLVNGMLQAGSGVSQSLLGAAKAFGAEWYVLNAKGSKIDDD
jgi:predicted lipoprotein with Yx(FWY)xxD motif